MPDRPAESLRLTPLEPRLTPAAYTLDPGFAPAAPDAAAVYAQPDGQVVVASRSDVSEQFNTVTLTRYSANGTPDSSFGPGGSYKLPLAVADYRPVEIEPRAGGYAVLLASQNAVSVADVPNSGAAGATGASAFSVTTIPTPFRVQDADLAVLADGGARVASRAADSSVVETDLIAPSGQLDARAQRRFTPSLGNLSAAAGQPDRVRDIKISPDGSVYVAVAAAGGQSGGVAKLQPDGTPDPSFDGDGVQSLATNASAQQLAVAPDGSVWVYGTSAESGGDGVFSRLTPAGAFDPAFGTAGTATWKGDGTAREASDLLVRPQGDAILTGSRGSGPSATPLIARVSDRGRTAEALTGPLDSQPGAVTAASLTADGKSLIVARPAGLNRLNLPEFAPDPAATAAARTPQSVAVFGPNAATAVTLAGKPDGTYSLDVGTAVPTGFNRGSGARVAHADIDGDGAPDTIFASGPGAAEIEIVLATGQALSVFSPYEAAYLGGLFVAARDLDGDNKADLVVSPDQGGGAVVVVYSGAELAAGRVGQAAQVARFYGVADRDFRGGAKVALGDISSDGRPDIVVAAGDGGGPRVTAWENRSVLAGSPAMLSDFFAFDPSSRTGVNVAVGNFTTPGQIAVGAGVGGGPRVRILDGNTGNEPREAANFFAFDPNQRSGVRLAAIDGNGDGVDELVTASGPGLPGKLRVFPRGQLVSATPVPSLDIDVFAPGELAGGVYVG